MDMVFVNPTSQQLRDAFHAAAVEANKGARTRTIETDPGIRCLRVSDEASGVFDVNGGGVANAYGYAAETSALESAWFTDPTGAKHVRIVSARVRVSGRHVSTILPGTRAQQQKLIDAGAEFCLVYADLFRCYAGSVAGAEGFSKKLKKNPADSVTWLALADWLDENGTESETAARIRTVFLRAESVATDQ